MKLVQFDLFDLSAGKTTCLTLLALSLLAGCSSSGTQTDSTDLSNVKKVDPLTVAPDGDGDAGSPASDTKAAVNLKRNFYFVFDGSGSMKDAPPSSDGGDQKFHSKIEGAKWAVNEFMKSVPDNVNLGLFVFDSRGEREVLHLGSNNRQEFLKDINRVDPAGWTPLGDAISKGATALAKQYKNQMGYGDFRLIVITDGEANDSINKGIATALKYNIPIYTIGFGIGPKHSLRKYSISYRSADSAKQVENALEEAAAELDVFDATSFKKKK